MIDHEKTAVLIYLIPVLFLAYSCAIFGRMPPRPVVVRVLLWPVFALLWAVPQGFWIWSALKWVSRQARYAAKLAVRDLDRAERLSEMRK